MRKIKVTVEKTATGFSAYTDDFPGVISTGRNWDEMKENFSEAFQFHLEGLKEDGEEMPQDYSLEFSLEFSLDVSQFFEYYTIFNVSALAKYLKINPQLLHQYKDGHKSVSEKTSLKILNGVHRFAEELLSSV